MPTAQDLVGLRFREVRIAPLPALAPRSLARRLWALIVGRPPVAAFLFAIAPRASFLFALRERSPTFRFLDGGDSILYDRIASGVTGPPRAFFHSPLYVGFLKSCYAVIGHNLLAVRVVQHLLGAAACALAAHVTELLFRSRTIALVAGLVAAVLGPTVFYEGMIGVDALMPSLVMACAALALRAWRLDDGVAYGQVGAAIGVTALGRAVILSWIPFLVVWIWTSGRVRYKNALALFAGLAVAVAPATMHNYLAEHTLVPITANGGLNLYIGNHEAANGGYVLPQGMWFRPGDVNDDYEGRRVAEETTGRRLNSEEVSAWWSRRAWTFVRRNPMRAVELVVRKVEILTNDAEYTQLHDYSVYREVAPILGDLASAGWIVAPGLAGIVALFLDSENRCAARRVALLALAFAASFLPFFVVGRYRAPWLLLLVPFAAFAAARFVALCRKPRIGGVVGGVALVAALALVVTTPLDLPSKCFQYMSFAHAALEQGHRRSAEHWCERALQVEPDHPQAIAMLGRLLREDGALQDAEALLTNALKRTPGNAGAWLELGRVRIAAGELDLAARSFMRSIDTNPRRIAAWQGLASTLRALGRDGESDAAARSAQRLFDASGGDGNAE